MRDYIQFYFFLRLLSDPGDDEVYFLSLSARNKYLTDEERILYGLGRTEMFSRTIARDRHLGYHRAMAEMNASLSWRRTSKGLPIPQKALVAYANLIPSSTLDAYGKFTSTMGLIQSEIIKAIRNGKNPNMDAFLRLDKKLMTNIQQASGKKVWVDIDFDSKDREALSEFRQRITGTDHYVISSHGGYHILIRSTTMTRAVSLAVGEFNDKLDGEVIFNRNNMIPIPVTLQAGHLVKFI